MKLLNNYVYLDMFLLSLPCLLLFGSVSVYYIIVVFTQVVFFTKCVIYVYCHLQALQLKIFFYKNDILMRGHHDKRFNKFVSTYIHIIFPHLASVALQDLQLWLAS